MSEDRAPSRARGKIYSAPRRFDLATILVVTTAYAALYSLLQAMGSPPILGAISAVYFTVIALAQAILFRGKRPRRASLLTGAILFVGASLIAQLPILSRLGAENLVFLLVYSTAMGAFLGYIGGVLVGFVFMVAELVRKLIG